MMHKILRGTGETAKRLNYEVIAFPGGEIGVKLDLKNKQICGM